VIRLVIPFAALSVCAVGTATEPLELPVVDAATVDVLATTYAFDATGAPPSGCTVSLAASPVERAGRPVTIGSACGARYPVLAAVTHWEPTGGASISLLDKRSQASSDLSPVQDGTGVYLRGGFEGDQTVYEMRPPQ
jgi:hypothetical protein